MITDTATQAAKGNNSNVRAPTNATLLVTDTKLYVPVVALSTLDNTGLLQQLKFAFKRTINWNKYRSDKTKNAKTNILSYLIDPLSFENKYDRILY